MATPILYRCSDCGFRGKRVSSLGRCPACDSTAISAGVSTGAAGGAATDDSSHSRGKRWRIALLIVLWGFLAWAIIDKLST